MKINSEKKQLVEIGINGALYKKKGLPERRLLNTLEEKKILTLDEAQNQSKLSKEEFKASIGALKKKALIELKNGRIIFSANKEEISKKMLEEIFIESLPVEFEKLTPEQNYALKALQNRKDIIKINQKKIIKIELTDLGKTLIRTKINHQNLIEQITLDILKKDSLWKNCCNSSSTNSHCRNKPITKNK